MILVADSGSTKTDWGVITEGKGPTYFSTPGYNPFFAEARSIQDRLLEDINVHMNPMAIRRVYFYGAGCQGQHIATMERVLQQVFKAAHVQVEVDLLAGAKALLDDKPGFAAILGTGTNTCLYDGRHIAYHIDSLGFLLGDEGSGAAIGKRILMDFLRNQMGGAERNVFKRIYGLEPDQLMQQVYNSKYPNQYCASFAKFLDESAICAGYRNDVVGGAFRDFFERLVCLYPDYQSLTFNCVGSIGYHFRDILKMVAENYGMKVGIILPGVIERLTLHHEKVESKNSK